MPGAPDEPNEPDDQEIQAGTEGGNQPTDVEVPGSVAPPSSPSATIPSPQSSLPFTGLVAPVLLGIGLLMLCAGLIARKLHARGDSS